MKSEKNISNLLMFFHFWDFERFLYFCILYFRISAFPTFGSAEMQKCRNAEINISTLLVFFFTFHISIDLLISENRRRFSKITKSIEIWKVKNISNLFMFFHVYYVDWFGYLCISAFPRFRKWEMQKCRNAKCGNRQIARKPQKWQKT